MVGCGLAGGVLLPRYNTLQGKYHTLQGNYAALQAKQTATQAELTASESVVSDLRVKLATATGELNAIKAVWPLKQFPSLRALREWRAKQPVPVEESWSEVCQDALELQQAAERDGYRLDFVVYYDYAFHGWIVGLSATLVGGNTYVVEVHAPLTDLSQPYPAYLYLKNVNTGR